MTATPTCYEETEVRLTGRDVWIARLALEELLAMTTREEHLVHDIRAALAKLPAAHEPGGAGCACLAQPAEARPQTGRAV